MILINKDMSLISVVTLTYQNFDKLFATIDSILQQDYPNIEIIISDDCSEDFDADLVNKYIKANKKNNIKNVVINKNKVNLGTVKNVNKALKLASGIYISFLSSNDLFNDRSTLTKLEKEIKNTNAPVIVAVSKIYNAQKQSTGKYLPTHHTVNTFNQMDNKQRYLRLCTKNLLGGSSVFFRRSFTVEYPYYDEAYFLTEDWPTWLSMTRNNIDIRLSSLVTTKYYQGGVTSNTSTNIKTILRQDMIKMYENEVFPFIKNEGAYFKKEINFIYKKAKNWDNMNFINKLVFCLLNMDIIIKRRILNG